VVRRRDIRTEGEDPKAVFHQATSSVPAFEYVDRILKRNTEWEPFGSSHGWALEYQDYSSDLRQPPTKWIMVWWDNEAQEWVMKIEGQRKYFGRWSGRHDFGFRTFKSGRELIAAIRQRRHLFLEAEDPKAFLKKTAPDIEFQQLLRKMELEDVPWPDSFKPGQRVRRTRLSPFGARPHGGNPNDIGDLGTIVAFHGRKDEPEHSLYTLRWDRYPIGIEYCTHRNVEAVNEADRVAEAILDGEDPKAFLKQFGTGQHIRNRRELRQFIAGQLRRMPDFKQPVEAWYRQLDRQIMPAVMKALESFYQVQAPDGTKELFRTWVKNDNTDRRAEQIIQSFEEIIKKE